MIRSTSVPLHIKEIGFSDLLNWTIETCRKLRDLIKAKNIVINFVLKVTV